MNFNFRYIGIDKRIDIDSLPIKAKSSDDSIVVRNKYNSVVSVYTDFFVTVAK